MRICEREIQLERAVLQLAGGRHNQSSGARMYTAMQLKVNTCILRAYCTSVGTSCSIYSSFFFFLFYKLLQLIARGRLVQRRAGFSWRVGYFIPSLHFLFLESFYSYLRWKGKNCWNCFKVILY